MGYDLNSSETLVARPNETEAEREPMWSVSVARLPLTEPVPYVTLKGVFCVYGDGQLQQTCTGEQCISL